MYQVIIILDEERSKSYYHSYVESTDTTLGNISVSELPPYADINKAQACYWDANNLAWVFDEEKYASIIAKIEANKEAAEQAQLEAEATPTNGELAECVMELGDGQSILSEAVAELGEGQGVLYDAVAELGEGQALMMEMLTELAEKVSALENPTTDESIEETEEESSGEETE